MKGCDYMKQQKTISELTLEELREIVNVAEEVNKNCSGLHCGWCIIDSGTYTDAPNAPCDEVFRYLKEQLAKKEAEPHQSKEPVPQEFEYTDDYVFTPENTSLEYLIENNLLQKLDDYIGRGNENGGRDRRNNICSKSSCGNCRLYQSKFSETLIVNNESNCSAVGDGITALRVAFDKLNELATHPPKRIQKTCADCKYRTEIGGYIYCNAWKNFTTDTMTCGYYLTKDTESDILETP